MEISIFLDPTEEFEAQNSLIVYHVCLDMALWRRGSSPQTNETDLHHSQQEISQNWPLFVNGSYTYVAASISSAQSPSSASFMVFYH